MASTYSQPGGKRQKVREARPDVDYFQGIDKLEYNTSAGPAADMFYYRYYNSGERVHSRSMDDWLKCSVSLTHFKGYGSDHLNPSSTRQWNDNTNTLDNCKRCIKALFEFCTKLGVRYWTAFDSDLVPRTESWEESKQYYDEIAEYIAELIQRTHVKLLWLAPDLRSHYRYTSGALTSPDATNFTFAATQIKKCLEISQKLNAECFLIWPNMEGYDAIFQTDISRELKLFAKLLKITTDYKDRLNYRCQLLIMPYSFSRNGSDGRNDCDGSFYWQHCSEVQTYVWDVTSCLYFLKNYNLDRFYKVCTPPGHHMYMANVYNILGGVFITSDFNQYDTKLLTLMMKCIVEQGGPLPAGISLCLPPRPSAREALLASCKYIDALARALRLAAGLVTNQVFVKHVQQRYATYYSGFGSRLVSSDVSIEECEDYYKKNMNLHTEVTSKAEQLDLTLQRYVDNCDHI